MLFERVPLIPSLIPPSLISLPSSLTAPKKKTVAKKAAPKKAAPKKTAAKKAKK
jgi:hypothetical protein